MLRLVEINSKVKLDKMSTKDSQEFQDAMQAGQKGERSYGPNDFGLWFLKTPSARTETPETGRGAYAVYFESRKRRRDAVFLSRSTQSNAMRPSPMELSGPQTDSSIA